MAVEPNDRSTAGLDALVDPPEPRQDTWYLVLALPGGESSRVVPVADGAEVVFGRQSGSQVWIDHDAVSRRHAMVRRRGIQIIVEDLGSRNGTLVNGTPITTPRRLSPGDEITVGPAIAIVATTTAMRRRTPVGTLTELEDRLSAEVDRALRYHRQLGLVMLRLEGHADAVATRLDTLATDLRRMDFLAEYGPDEFAIVLPEASPTATEAVAARLARHRDRVTIHVGTASFPVDGTAAGELIGVVRAKLRGARIGGARGGDRDTASQVALAGKQVVVIDPVMKQVFHIAKQSAATTITVLVVGETGTGKEVVAEAVHRYSPRADKPYIRLNCASLPETLLEAELFGHERGAFTGATRQKQGYFEAASGGTLFLDEIGELPQGAQAKLLRALEARRITRVGGTDEIPVDVRVVCATNRDLEAEIRRGRFREDLYFRIGGFVIPVPPLRDRRGEIEPFARQFAREIANDLSLKPSGFAPLALAALTAYDWPGNVRELRNAIERAVVLASGGPIDLDHLPDRLRDVPGAAPVAVGDGEPALDVRRRVAEVERGAVVAALDESGGNQTQAAKKLGVSRFALIRLMDKHGLRRGARPR
jgi:DNA-binding NtrC family response regulator/pSer/pThr/pTyr-binding forkhead associated (FHA) protein